MTKPVLFLLVLLTLAGCGGSADSTAGVPLGPVQPQPQPGPAPVLSYRIVNTFPHRTDAFTQGLEYADGLLYESTGLVGQSSLREVALTTGTVLRQQNVSGVFAEGLALRNDTLYQLTLDSGTAFLWGRDSFLQQGTLPIPAPAWGLTLTDDDVFAFSDGTSTLRFLVPETMSQVRQVTVVDNGQEVDRLNELEFVDGLVYANRFTTDEIVAIDPDTGEVAFRLDLSGLIDREANGLGAGDVLNGIAYDEDGKRLFVTGKRWPFLYQIELVQ